MYIAAKRNEILPCRLKNDFYSHVIKTCLTRTGINNKKPINFIIKKKINDKIDLYLIYMIINEKT